MNQGNDKSHGKDDGVFRDGCLIFLYPKGKLRAFYMAFQSQSFHTDDKTGHAISDGTKPAAPPATKKSVTMSTKKSALKKAKKK